MTLPAGTAFRTQCGNNIVLNQRTLTHLASHPDVLAVLPAAIAKLDLRRQSFVSRTIVFDSTIGTTDLIKTEAGTSGERMMFAYRAGRTLPSRVIMAEAVPTNSVHLIAKKMGAEYVLITCYFGANAPKEPWDTTLRAEDQAAALEFWCQHGLAYSPEKMGAPFESTWDDVLRKALESQADLG